MSFDIDRWTERAARGFMLLIVIIGISSMLVTALGRGLLIITTVFLVLITILGYVLEVLEKAYYTHIK